MPRKAKELSAKAVEKLSKDGAHAVGGVDGLLLQVRGENARSWVLRVRINEHRRTIGLGAYPELSLAEARRKAQAMRLGVSNGIDPFAERKAARQTALIEDASVLTFDEAARRLITAKSSGWQNAKHRAQWQNTLDTYASPVIGAMSVKEIRVPDVLRVLEPIWTVKTETAKRVQLRIEAVMDWATAAQYREGANPAAWRGRLDKILPKPGDVRRVKHHAALPIDAMHDFMTALRERAGIAARALEFAILTAARSGEVRGATWDEIDLEAGTWTVPAVRMKAKREHVVPLSTEAQRILRALPRCVGTDLVFPSSTGTVLSDMTLLAVVKRMGVDAVPHGFRSTFRDWASERTSYAGELAEKALAHAVRNKTEAAYRRGDLLAKRAQMMADWASFIDTAPSVGNVTTLRRKA